MKKEAGKVVETSGDENVVKPLATKELLEPKKGPPKKGGPKVFEFSKF